MALKGVRFAEFDRKLLFENETNAVNPVGNVKSKNWTTAFTAYGKFLTVEQPERFEGNQQVGVQGARVIIRYRSDVKETQRFTDVTENAKYNVKSIQKMKREGYCIITAEKTDR